MKATGARASTIEVLLAARRIADHAKDEGAQTEQWAPRSTCEHLGAVLADSVLQAGLNYSTVVRPRVIAILRSYSKANSVSALQALIERQQTKAFLNWTHAEKVNRFEALVAFLNLWGIETVDDLRVNLASEHFCDALQTVNGIGPKTVDYMSCLVGIDSIAVDRHVRKFAKKVGVENDDYHFLRRSFCCAADLLELSRREFDAWLWRSAVSATSKQLSLGV